MKQKIALIALTSALGLMLGLANAEGASMTVSTDTPVLTAAADVTLPEASHPDMDQDHAAGVDVETPDVAHADVDVEKPDLDKPEVERPDMEKPEIEHPDVEHPDTSH